MIRALAPLTLAALGLWSCAPDGPDAPKPAGASGERTDDGAVLAVDGVRIAPDEVDAVAALVGELFPAYTQPHRRRLALTNVVLPRAAVRARFPEERERARRAAEEAAATLAAPASDAERAALEARAVPVSGYWKVLGLDLWGATRGLQPGRWSAPLERVGRFTLARLDAPRPADVAPEREELTISVLDFPYLDPEQPDNAVEAALDGSRLRILDPAWHEVIPERWKYRMRATD